MLIRRPKVEDEERIHELSEKYDFILPSKFREAAVVEKSGKVIAFGLIRHIIEAVMVCDGSKRDVVEATKLLIEQAKFDSFNLGHNEIHVSVESLDFEEILKKHFGFKETSGKILVLKIGEVNGQR